MPPLSDRAAQVITEAQNFAARYLAPHAPEWEHDGHVPRRAFTEAAQAGLCGVMVPEPHGGAALNFSEAAVVLEILSRESAAFAFGLWVHNNVANAIARHGTHDQIAVILPAMLSGARIGAFCLTEPNKGSDATAIETLATKTDSGWAISGEKAWITNGVYADILVVYAQTETGKGASGIAAFIVDGHAGKVGKGTPYDLPGATAFGLSDIRLENCEIEDTSVLVPPGEGFSVAMSGINQARIFVGTICNGMLSSSLDIALEYSAHREVSGLPVLEYQGIQWSLADVATDLEASHLLVKEGMRMLDAGEPVAIAAAHAKKFASRVAFDGISTCMQAMGAAGLRSHFPLSRHLTAAKMMHFVDGTTEIQNVVIARELMRRFLPKKPPN